MNYFCLILFFSCLIQKESQILEKNVIWEGNCDILVHLDKHKGSYTLHESKTVILTVFNKGVAPLNLPEELNVGDSFDRETEIILELKMFVPKKCKFIPIDEVPEYSLFVQDHDRLLHERKTIFIAPSETKNFNIGIEFMHSLIYPGIYKIRANVKFNEVSKCDEIRTNWIKLKVTEE